MSDPLADAIGALGGWNGQFNWESTPSVIADAIREGALADHLADVPAESLGLDAVEFKTWTDYFEDGQQEFGWHLKAPDGSNVPSNALYRRRGGDTA